jgi:hypothetical protein
MTVNSKKSLEKLTHYMAPSNKAVILRALAQKTADKLGKFADSFRFTIP